MSRYRLARKPWALMGFFALAAGCQSYNFNPVGSCMLHPGRTEFKLSDISTSDVLFVVDDSNSMSAEQVALASNFGAYIGNLDSANSARVASGLDPYDFHIAVTTTSVFFNPALTTGYTQTCRRHSVCGGSLTDNSLVCCMDSGATPTAALAPRRCTGQGDLSCGSLSCKNTCNGLNGEWYCCNTDNSIVRTELIPCSLENRACGRFDHHFQTPLPSCTPGVAVAGYPFARGDFVSLGTNPRVLHFDKVLYDPNGTGTNRQGFTSAELMSYFSSNVIVGTCGSGEEQGLSGARLALEKAWSGQQTDTYTMEAGKHQVSNPPPKAEWPHDNSQLVLVFVGDEDDCSSQDDPSAGVVMNDPAVKDFTDPLNPRGISGRPGDDACVWDPAKLYDVASHFADDFVGRGRPVVAAFVEAAAETQCGYGSLEACKPGTCCQYDCPDPPPPPPPAPAPPAIPAGYCAGPGRNLYDGTTNWNTGDYPYYCGGQAPATRFFDAANLLESRGAKIFKGSICDGDFRTLLDEIGKLSIPPPTLTLPTLPASSDIVVLRIIAKDGTTTRRFCGSPAPGGLTQATAAAQGYEWWFNLSADAPLSTNPTFAVSKFVYINPVGGCMLNPGETYSAEYIGRLPEAGCVTDADCQSELGGSAGAWTCYAGTHDVGAPSVNKCIPPSSSSLGTCLCGSPTENCPNGKG